MKLKVKDISKNYNRYSALRGVNLELEPGLYGLLGPNGAGKSTLLKIIAGILRPTAGSILLDNEPVSKLGEHYRAMLGYMPQDLGIYPEFTAKRYLLYIILKPFCRKENVKTVSAGAVLGIAVH